MQFSRNPQTRATDNLAGIAYISPAIPFTTKRIIGRDAIRLKRGAIVEH
jgi:hypothetical protein